MKDGKGKINKIALDTTMSLSITPTTVGFALGTTSGVNMLLSYGTADIGISKKMPETKRLRAFLSFLCNLFKTYNIKKIVYVEPKNTVENIELLTILKMLAYFNKCEIYPYLLPNIKKWVTGRKNCKSDDMIETVNNQYYLKKPETNINLIYAIALFGYEFEMYKNELDYLAKLEDEGKTEEEITKIVHQIATTKKAAQIYDPIDCTDEIEYETEEYDIESLGKLEQLMDYEDEDDDGYEEEFDEDEEDDEENN